MCEKIDILEIDDKIKKKFCQEYENLPNERKRIQEMNETLERLSSPTAKLELMNNIYAISEKIQKIENREDHKFYLSETMLLLEEYKRILLIPMKISFVKRGKDKSNHENTEKVRVIQEFLHIAKKYTPIPGYVRKSRTLICPDCKGENFTEGDGCVICVECGTEQDSFDYKISLKEIDRSTPAGKSAYDRKTHFRDCINQYQAKQNCTVQPQVYQDLEQAFERHHLLIGDKDTPKEIRFSRITRDNVSMFLKELGYNKHYENVILIHFHMTGKKPDDISHLEHVLLADFNLLLETYDKYFKHKIDRINFISAHYVLYQLLQKYKHPCKKEDFVNLKTTDRKTFHDDICAELFEKLGWNFIPVH